MSAVSYEESKVHDGSSVRSTLTRRVKLGMPVTHILLIATGFFYIYPFLWMISGSLKSLGGFFNQGLSLIPDAWLWSNFVDAWTKGSFGQYFGNTVIITVMSVVFSVLFASMAGYALARLRVPGKRIILGAIIVMSLLPKGNSLLPTFEVIQFLGLNDSLMAIIVLHVAGSVVGGSLFFAGYFLTLSREIEEAAIVDGANRFRIYWNIALPLAAPMIATQALFSFIGSWNDFLAPLVFTLGNPDLRTLAVGVYSFSSEHTQQWPLICAGAVISLIPIAIIFFALQRYFIEGLAGAVK